MSKAQILELLIGPNGATSFTAAADAQTAWAEFQPKLSPFFAASWYASEAFERKPFAAIAEQYARDVVDGCRVACGWVKLACKRHLDDLERAKGEWAYRFDTAKAERICRFAELLPHVKGKWAANSEPIRLEPWQVFYLSCLFGWVKKSTGMRRFSLGYIEVARKNAKSILAAIIGLYMFACDAEFGAEVYSGATSEDQAYEVYRPARQMMVNSPELAGVLGLIPVKPTTKGLATAEDRSRFEPVIGKPGDGASPHCGIVDEYHEHDSDVLFDTLRTGMGARTQPLLLVITTAGDNTAGPCKLLQGDICKVLEGSIERDEVFGIVYSIDAGDDWTSDMALLKANPNIDVSVFREFLQTDQRAAVVNPRKRGIFQTKHLCVWVGAISAYFDVARWKELGDPSLKMESFIGLPCVASDDLSTKRDFTCRVVLFKKIMAGKEHYYHFVRFYLPEEQVLRPDTQHYQEWRERGHLIAHEGSTVDFELIANDTVEDVTRCRAREFAFDPWNAAQLGQEVGKRTKAITVEIPQNAATLNAPMKELDVLIAEGRIHHEGNPVLAWMMGNVMAKEDANENVFPRKEKGREEKKIDGASATIMALARLMVAPAKKSIYSTRGLLTLAPQTAVHA